jgi:hypothetical protein
VLGWAQKFTVGGPARRRSRACSLIRTGVVTHDFNSNQRFQSLSFHAEQRPAHLEDAGGRRRSRPRATTCCSCFDAHGVPSVAKIFRIGT